MENSEHIVFVVLHLGKNAAPSLAQTGFISSSVGRDIELKDRSLRGSNRSALRRFTGKMLGTYIPGWSSPCIAKVFAFSRSLDFPGYTAGAFKRLDTRRRKFG